MRVACPECSAEYDLPPALAARLAEGRTVRCARCGTAWAPGVPEQGDRAADRAADRADLRTEWAEEPEGGASAPSWDLQDRPGDASPAGPLPGPASPEPPVPLPPSSQPAVAEASPEPRATAGRRAAGLGWAASLLLLVGAAAAAWFWRIELVAAWPPAARAFMALGLAG
jgi:predicted Zn finger-like uncharacterized protein